MTSAFLWSTTAAVGLSAAGRFRLDDRDFSTLYRSGTLAVHAYDYAARWRQGADECDLQPGDVTLSPPDGETRYHLPRPGWHWCVHVLLPADAPMRNPPPLPTAARLRTAAAADASVAIPLHLRLPSEREAVWEQFRRLAGDAARLGLDGGDAAGAALLSAQVQALLARLAAGAARAAATPPTRGAAAVERAAAILAAECARPPAIPELARRLGVEQAHLARLFRRRFGMTMPRYVLARRVDLARYLASTSDQPFARIAAAAGFSDVQHFAKVVRLLTGAPPSALRGGEGGSAARRRAVAAGHPRGDRA